MKIICIPVTMMNENAYICYDENTLCGVVIDPGGEPEKLIEVISREGIEICAILLTHGHCDHIGAAPELQIEYDAPVICEKNEEPFLMNPDMNMSSRFGGAVFISPDETYSDGDEVEYAGIKFLLMHTPGHTPGSCCYYHADEKILFSGDTLFYGSIGRSDFYLGDHAELIKSIKDKLFALADDTAVYPGHGAKTDIGYEKRHNPFVK